MSLFNVELPDNTAICPQCGIKYDIHGWHTCDSITNALAARDKEWVEFIESITSGADPNLTYIKTKKWQERKKSLGVPE